MNRVISAIREVPQWFSNVFRLDQMSREFMVFINTYFCFGFATNLSTIFISTFLFQANGEMRTVALFYLFYFLCEMTGVYLVVRLSHRISNVHFTVIGLVLNVVAYLMLLIARQNSIHIYPVIAIVYGLGGGFYWNAYHSLIQTYTTDQNRQFGMAYAGIITNVIVLVAPTLSGIILVSIPGILGYMLVFATSFAFFIAAFFIIIRLKAEKKSPVRRKLLSFIRSEWKNKILNYSMAGEFIRGLREGVYIYYLNILIFSMTSNELVLGLTSTVKGAAAVFIFYLLGRRTISRNGRMALMLASSIISIVVTSSLFFWYTAVAVVIYCVLDNSTQVVINNFAQYTGYEIAKCTSRDRDCRMENAGLRLMALEMGRVIGILASFLVPAEGNAIIVFFVILGIVNLSSWWVYQRASKICEKMLDEVEA